MESEDCSGSAGSARRARIVESAKSGRNVKAPKLYVAGSLGYRKCKNAKIRKQGGEEARNYDGEDYGIHTGASVPGHRSVEVHERSISRARGHRSAGNFRLLHCKMTRSRDGHGAYSSKCRD